MTSQFEGYLSAISDQELPTKYLLNKRDKDAGKTPTYDTKCRLCKHATEDIPHIISSCPQVSSRYYLPLRHDAMGKCFLKAYIKKHHPDHKYIEKNENEYILKIDNTEYWWNISIENRHQITTQHA